MGSWLSSLLLTCNIQVKPHATFGWFILGLSRFFCPCYEAFWTAPSSLALKNMVLHAKRVGKPDIYLATGVTLSRGVAMALGSSLVEVLVAPLHRVMGGRGDVDQDVLYP